jgi:hypothetical protein
MEGRVHTTDLTKTDAQKGNVEHRHGIEQDGS